MANIFNVLLKKCSIACHKVLASKNQFTKIIFNSFRYCRFLWLRMKINFIPLPPL